MKLFIFSFSERDYSLDDEWRYVDAIVHAQSEDEAKAILEDRLDNRKSANKGYHFSDVKLDTTVDDNERFIVDYR